MITAAVYWAMKFQFGADWSAWCLVLPVLLDIVCSALSISPSNSSSLARFASRRP